jgi:uncharacterized protein YjiS (DUF1127 family)
MNPKRTCEALRADRLADFPSPTELVRSVEDSRRLRAEATADMIASLARTVARSVRRGTEPLARWQEQRRTYQALSRLSDRALADIGIERDHIALVAKGIDPHEHDLAPTGWRRWWQETGRRLDAAQRARRECRRVYRELMAYTNRELDDLGIRRVDIPAIARGRLPAAA